MDKKIRWITETAVLLAMLVALQALTKPMGQLVTGSCVNAILAIGVLFAGLGSGITVAVISPVLAFALGIAPQILTVPAIMLGNTAFVCVLHFCGGKVLWKNAAALALAAAGKFVLMFGIVKFVICGVLADNLLAQGLLKAPMLNVLPVTFGVTQLFTALIGGTVALLIAPMLRKALHK